MLCSRKTSTLTYLWNKIASTKFWRLSILYPAIYSWQLQVFAKRRSFFVPSAIYSWQFQAFAKRRSFFVPSVRTPAVTSHGVLCMLSPLARSLRPEHNPE
ncbi:MAG: hypothetical protein IKO26_08590 [Paludibacteraceae bacterium]|nr:hypothetical protein [Paludibacteraceae bacterium]